MKKTTTKYAKGGSAKKPVKAKDGLFVRTKTVDPEGNTVKSRTNTRTGRNVTKVTYSDPASSGMKREKIVTPGLSRFERKANEMYAKNPKAAKEDAFSPFTTRQKKGGTIKKMSKTSKKK